MSSAIVKNACELSSEIVEIGGSAELVETESWLPGKVSVGWFSGGPGDRCAVQVPALSVDYRFYRVLFNHRPLGYESLDRTRSVFQISIEHREELVYLRTIRIYDEQLSRVDGAPLAEVPAGARGLLVDIRFLDHHSAHIELEGTFRRK